MVRWGIQPQRTERVPQPVFWPSKRHRNLINYLIMYEVKIKPPKLHNLRAIGKGESSER